jgi:protein-disulfide isomerase
MLMPVDAKVDHVRGTGTKVIVVYGDFECPYTRQAYREIREVENELDGDVVFAFRHYPLTEIHPHALAASKAAEAAAGQGRYWEMHDTLFHRQKALEDEDLRGYAKELGLDLDAFDRDRNSQQVIDRINRDIDSGDATGEVFGTPTIFVNGKLHRGAYDAPSLVRALSAGE